MVDPITASGLASSIITFIEIGYKVGERTAQFARLSGRLPRDLEALKVLVDVVIRSGRRLHASITSQESVPSQAMSDFKDIFEQYSGIAEELVRILDQINGAGSSSSSSLQKAVKSIRKEGRLQRMRNDLHEKTLIFLQLLEEHTQNLNREMRFVIVLTNLLVYYIMHKIVWLIPGSNL
jgi:hypothetical protein